MPEQGEFRWKLTADDSEYQRATGRVQKAQERLLKSTAKLAGVNSKAFGPKQQVLIDKLTQKLQKQQESAQRAANSHEKALNKQATSAARYEESIARQQQLIEGLQGKWDKVVDSQKAEAELKLIEQATELAKNKFEELTDTWARLNESLAESVTPENLELRNQIQADARQVVNDIELMEKKAAELREQLEKAPTPEFAKKLESDLEQAINKLDRLQNEAQISGDELQRNADLAAQHYERLSDEASQTADQIRQAANASEKLEKPVSKSSKGMRLLAEMAKKANNEIKNTNKSAGGLLGSVDKLQKRLLKLGAAVFVFNQIRKALRNLQSYLWDVLKTNDQLIASLASVKGNLLTAFQPIYEAALPAINALAIALAKVTAYIAAFVNLLFGKSIKASQDSAKGLYDQAKALNATGKAADKAAGALAAFDEINVLQKENAAGGGSNDVIIPDFEYDTSGIESWLDEFETWPEKFYAIGEKIAKNLNNALAKIDWETVKKNAEIAALSIASLFNGIVDNVDWSLLGYTVGEGINTAFTFAYTIAKNFNWQGLGEGIGEAINKAVSTTDWDLVGRTFASKWNALILTLNGIVTKTDWKKLGASIGTSVNAWFDEIEWGKAGETVSKGLAGILETASNAIKEWDTGLIIDSLDEFVEGLDLESVVQKFFEILGVSLGKIGEFILEVTSRSLFAKVDFYKELFGDTGEAAGLGFWEGIKNAFKNTIILLKEYIFDPFISGIKSLFEIHSPSQVMAEIGEFLIQGLADGVLSTIPLAQEHFTYLWESIKEGASLAWEKVQEIWSVVSDWFKSTVISPLTDAFKGFANTTLEFFGNMANGIIGIFEKAINWIIDAINKIKFDVPNWVPGVGGKSFSPNISNIALSKVEIPKLATGAVIPPNSEFFAVLGDQKSGTNIEAPLDTIVNAMLTALENAEIGSGDVNVNINFTGDLAALGRILNPVIQAEQRRSGVNLITGGAY